MPLIQVSREGGKFVVLSDGATVPGLRFDTMGEAVAAALTHKENHS